MLRACLRRQVDLRGVPQRGRRETVGLDGGARAQHGGEARLGGAARGGLPAELVGLNGRRSETKEASPKSYKQQPQGQAAPPCAQTHRTLAPADTVLCYLRRRTGSAHLPATPNTANHLDEEVALLPQRVRRAQAPEHVGGVGDHAVPYPGALPLLLGAPPPRRPLRVRRGQVLRSTVL